MSSRNILGGGHLLETSSRGARKSWGSKARFGRLGKSAGSLLSRRLPGGSSLRGLLSSPSSHHLTSLSSTRAITGTLSAAALLLLSAFLFPSLPDSAQAVEEINPDTTTLTPEDVATPGTSTSFAETNPSISTYASNPSASINLPSTIDFDDVLPTAEGVTTTASASLTITTSNSGGYSLYFYSSNGNNSLTPINPNNSSSISSTLTTTELDNLNNNTWGYNLSTEASTGSTTTYSAIPTSSTTPIQTKDTSTTNSANDTYTLSLGAKVDTTIPSGTYTNSLTIAIVAEPAAISDLTGVTYMQDVTAEICASTAEGTKATLTDRRDNNTYTVAKINGNCWMTQNLRLSSTTENGGSRVLTSADSNVTRNWTFPTGSLTSGTSFTEARSTISSNTSYGGYYNYCAASAGTVCNDTTKRNATQSICPAGWKLPTLSQFNAIARNSSYSSAFSPVYSGGYAGGSLSGTGYGGTWWSATADDSFYQYDLYYGSGSLRTSNRYKGDASSVRCVRSS